MFLPLLKAVPFSDSLPQRGQQHKITSYILGRMSIQFVETIAITVETASKANVFVKTSFLERTAASQPSKSNRRISFCAQHKARNPIQPWPLGTARVRPVPSGLSEGLAKLAPWTLGKQHQETHHVLRAHRTRILRGRLLFKTGENADAKQAILDQMEGRVCQSQRTRTRFHMGLTRIQLYRARQIQEPYFAKQEPTFWIACVNRDFKGQTVVRA